MPYSHHDGGRSAAGFKGEADDCACRAIAIAMSRSYQDVYDDLNAWCWADRATRRKKVSSARTGVYADLMKQYMDAKGWVWVPVMKIGSGCTMHLRRDELPSGRIIASVSKHYVAVIDGVIYDTHDSTRDGTRCVYGYWRAS